MKRILLLLAILIASRISSPAQNFASSWSSLGPVNMPYFETSMGRVNCITGPATDPNELLIGTPGGGVWRSDDGGLTWLPHSDSLPVLSVSSLVLDPVNTNTIYMATGDGDSPYLNTYSIGVWKSTNGCTNWNPTGLSWSLTAYQVIYKLAMAPGNSQEIFAATSDGIYVTYNGGTNWQESTPGGTTLFYDIQFQPGSSTNIYLTGQGAAFYTTTNGGTNWTHVTAGLPSSGVDRSELGVSAANPLGVYVLYGDSSSGAFHGLYQSTNAGVTFNQQTANNLSNLMFDGQERYDLALTVSPTNFNNVFAAGNLIGSSTDGGQNWTTSTYTGTHVDVHGLTVINGALYASTDGGIHKTLDGGNTWQDLSTNLQIAQIYHLYGAPQNPSLIYVGEQDDGLNQYSGGIWSHLLAGDFGQPIVNPTNQNIVYATAHGTYYETTDAWGSETQLSITSENAGFESPLAISPNNPAILYAGYENIWATTNGGAAWFPISSFTDGAICSTINLAPSNPNYIYAIRNGNVWRTVNAGTNWTQLSPPASGTAMEVAVSTSDPTKIWLAQNDYSTANKVYASTNAGTNWTAYTGSLPNRNVNSIVYEGASDDGLYIGFDAGIYYRNAAMGDWQTFNTNLPNARVVDLQIEYATLSLRAATFGRGLWQSLLAGANPVPPVITGTPYPVVAQDNSYSFPSVTKAISYQWMVNQLIPFNLVDGAENGLVNFTAAISSGYSATSSTVKASGNDSFHLAQPQPTDQFLTLNYNLLAQTNSAIQFSSLLSYATPGQVAEVQVSTNSGNSWQNVFSQAGTGAYVSTFTTKNVSLAAFAGSTIQVRFDYSYQSGSYYPQTSDYFGWYLDNITFTNLQELTNQTITAIPSGTNFNFVPSQVGSYMLNVRAVAYGPSYLSFGPPLFVSADTVPVLAFGVSGKVLTLSWSDPTFNVEQTSSLLPSSWTPVTGSSPLPLPITSPGSKFFRLSK